MIPTALGNTVGGGLFVAAIYWYLYLTGPGAEEIQFDLGGLDTAMEAGGPMEPPKRKLMPHSQSSQDEQDTKVVSGKELEEGYPNHVASLPSTGQHMASGIGRELSAEMYTHRKGEPSPIEGQAVRRLSVMHGRGKISLLFSTSLSPSPHTSSLLINTSNHLVRVPRAQP